MNRILLSLIVFTLTVLSCNKEDALKGTPTCIENKINEIAQEQVWNPPAKVYSYEYDGQTVYYFSSRCCDIPSELYDKDCNLLCEADGGLTGNGDGRCSDFFNTRTEEKLVWEDNRK